METKKHLATITILVKDRQSNVHRVNKLLTDNGNLVMARLGVNIEPRCVEHCTGMITVAVKGTKTEIIKLTKKINKLYGIVAKESIMTE